MHGLACIRWRVCGPSVPWSIVIVLLSSYLIAINRSCRRIVVSSGCWLHSRRLHHWDEWLPVMCNKPHTTGRSTAILFSPSSSKFKRREPCRAQPETTTYRFQGGTLRKTSCVPKRFLLISSASDFISLGFNRLMYIMLSMVFYR